MSNVAQKQIDLNTFTGSSAITSLGTISSGTWQGTAIAAAFVAAVTGATASAIPKSLTSGKLASGWGVPSLPIARRSGVTGPADTNKNAYFTYPVLANTLGSDKVVKAKFSLHKNSGANSVAVALEWNGNAMHSSFSATTLNFELDAVLMGDGATGSQRSTVTTESYTSGTITRTKTVSTYSVDQTSDRNLVLYVTKGASADVVTLDLNEITIEE